MKERSFPALDSHWRTSTRSQAAGNCVEVRLHNGTVQVRDTKDRTGPVLELTPAQWRDFVDEVVNGAAFS